MLTEQNQAQNRSSKLWKMRIFSIFIILINNMRRSDPTMELFAGR